MANLLKMSDNTLWHGNSSFYVSRNGTRYGLIDSMAEICAGGPINLGTVPRTAVSGSAPNYAENLTNSYTITFPITFSSKPIVILCDATNDPGYQYGALKPFVLRTDITTTNFKVRVANYTAKERPVKVSYIAIKPFQTLSNTVASKTADLKVKGSWKAPTAISTGTSITMSDNNYWSLSAVHDNRTTSSTLHDTYYTFDCGEIAGGNRASKSVTGFDITFNKVFASTPVVICCLTYSNAADITVGNTGRGAISCSIQATSTTKAKAYIYNASGESAVGGGRMSAGTCPGIGLNWIAFGKAEI